MPALTAVRKRQHHMITGLQIRHARANDVHNAGPLMTQCGWEGRYAEIPRYNIRMTDAGRDNPESNLVKLRICTPNRFQFERFTLTMGYRCLMSISMICSII